MSAEASAESCDSRGRLSPGDDVEALRPCLAGWQVYHYLNPPKYVE